MIKILKNVWSLLTEREKLTVVILLVLMLLSSALELLGIGLVMPVIALLSKPELIEQNRYLKAVYNLVAPDSYRTFMIILCIALIILYIMKNLFLAFQNYWQTHFIMKKGAELANKLFDNYIHAPYKFHLNNNSGTLLGKISMADALSVALLIPFMIILTESLVILFVFSTLLLLSPMVTIGLVIAITFITTVTYFPVRGLNSRLGLKYRNEQLAMNKYALQGLKAVKESKVRNVEDFFSEEYAEHRRRANEASAGINFMGNLPRFLVEGMLVSLGIGVLLLLVVMDMSPGSIILTLSLFAASAIRIMPSMTRIQYNLARVKQYSHTLNAVFDDISDFETEDKGSAENNLEFRKNIIIDKITFRYENTDSDVLKEFSLKIRKNSSVAFIGPTGCGKTTLVDIILGLLKPQKGALLVDGISIENNLVAWQKKIGYVPQFIFLLDDTVKANVAFGVPEDGIDDKRIVECLKLAQIYDFIKDLSGDINHIVGENGIQLSGGQRQRIGIARALYHNPEILILDEATSALDNDTEKAFIDALHNLHGKLTILMVAHRLTTVENCDEIIDLTM
jgi:ATP-binding cassette subfamily C protein